MAALQVVADPIVPAREEIVRQAEPAPPIAVEACEIGATPLRLGRKQAVFADLDFPVRAGTDLHLPLAAAAVNLTGVPPVRVAVAECRGGAKPGFALRLVRDGTTDRHAAVDLLGPIVDRLQPNLELIALLGLSMAEPVVRFKLDPGGGQEIECRGGNEVAARQQLFGDHPRA